MIYGVMPWFCKLRSWWLRNRLLKSADTASIGRLGEELARLFLSIKKYRIICQNWRYGHGEIDIIALDKNTNNIVFVEVKSRAEDSRYMPREAVTADKQRRIIKTALLYIRRYPDTRQVRFDVIEVVTDKTHPMKALHIHHIPNAYGG